MEFLLVIVVMVTSVGAYLIGIRWCGRSQASLGVALGQLLESLGIIAVFAVINFGLAGAFVLGARTFTPRFTSLYMLDDMVWVVVSVLQGIAWSLWRSAAAARADRGVPRLRRARTGRGGVGGPAPGPPSD